MSARIHCGLNHGVFLEPRKLWEIIRVHPRGQLLLRLSNSNQRRIMLHSPQYRDTRILSANEVITTRLSAARTCLQK